MGCRKKSRRLCVLAALVPLLSSLSAGLRAGDWAGDWACLKQGVNGDAYAGNDLSCTRFTGGPRAASPHAGWVQQQTSVLADPNWITPLRAAGVMPTAGNDYSSVRYPPPACGTTTPGYPDPNVAAPTIPGPPGANVGPHPYNLMSADGSQPPQVLTADGQVPPQPFPGGEQPMTFSESTQGSLLDNLSFFAGLDGSKQPQDYGVNAQMGGRISLNLGIPIQEEWGLGVQAGTAYNFSSAAMQVLPRLAGENERNQYYTTLGLFQRSPWGLNWSIAYDFLWEDYYDHFQFGQWRGRVGYQLTECNEIGVWFAKHDRGDAGTLLGIPTYLQPISQINAFWRHTWFGSAWTTLWVGAAQQHGRVVLGLPDAAPITHPFVYGADLNIPLNDWLSIWGEANFITPASSGTVDAYLGFAIYPGGGAKRSLQNKFQPLLPVANNNSFAIDLAR